MEREYKYMYIYNLYRAGLVGAGVGIWLSLHYGTAASPCRKQAIHLGPVKLNAWGATWACRLGSCACHVGHSSREFLVKGPPYPVHWQKRPHVSTNDKRTTSGVAAEPPGDTWRMPPGGLAAGACRPIRWRYVSRAAAPSAAVRHSGPCRRSRGRQSDMEHASTAGGGRAR
jgi:hypothetical protein